MVNTSDHSEEHERYCSGCGKTEKELGGMNQPAILQLCGTCRIARYCSESCQLVDWPAHRKACRRPSTPKQTKKTGLKLGAFRAWFLRTRIAPVPTHAIHAILQDWSDTYKDLLTFSLMNASDPVPYQPPQIFYVKLSMSLNTNTDIKARSALRLEDAEFLALEEFRRATVNKSHRLYSDENGQLLDGFNKYMRAGSRLGPFAHLVMVVQRLEVQQEGPLMTHYFKSWFYEGDSMTQTKLRDGTWLPYLKEKVAAGKGWSYNGVRFDE